MFNVILIDVLLIFTYYIKYVTYRNLFNAIKRRARDIYYGDLLAKYQMSSAHISRT